jgi:hypothetical protein
MGPTDRHGLRTDGHGLRTDGHRHEPRSEIEQEEALNARA